MCIEGLRPKYRVTKECKREKKNGEKQKRDAIREMHDMRKPDVALPLQLPAGYCQGWAYIRLTFQPPPLPPPLVMGARRTNLPGAKPEWLVGYREY